MARRAFKLDVLRILLSDFDKSPKQTSLGIKLSCCTGDMSVVIMDAEHNLGTDLVT